MRGNRFRGAHGIFFAALLAVAAPAVRAQQEPEPAEKTQTALNLGLTEKAKKAIVQIEATVSGPWPEISELKRADFNLVVGLKRIDEFDVDSLCTAPPVAMERKQKRKRTEDSAVEQSPTPTASARPFTYLFYFDQAHLTLAGRVRSLEIARDLIQSLVGESDRATIISNGTELRVFAESTSDREILTRALDTLARDSKQWDLYAEGEDARVNSVINAQEDHRSMGKSAWVRDVQKFAKQMAADEVWHTQRALRRFEDVLGRFARIHPPKAVIYFADTVRSNPGEHYRNLFSDVELSNPKGNVELARIGMNAFGAGSFLDDVINKAAAYDVRLYTVEARGLVTDSLTVRPSLASASHPAPWHKRHKDAQDALSSLALETGGRAFLNGTAPDRIAQTIKNDFSCFYVISVAAEKIPKERMERVVLSGTRPGIKVEARGRLFVQNESSRLTSELLAAFVAGGNDAGGDHPPLAITLLLSDFQDGVYQALVQVRVPAAQTPGDRTWDIGVSLIVRGKVREDAADRITLKAPHPVVYEMEVKTPPGPFEFAVVAHEPSVNTILNGSLTGELPDPDEAQVTIAQIARVQPDDTRIFLRSGEYRRPGSLALIEDESVSTDRGLALLSLVCRAKSRRKAPWSVERSIAAIRFPSISFDSGRCIQVRDLVGNLAAGSFQYHLSVLSDDQINLATKDYTFQATSSPLERP